MEAVGLYVKGRLYYGTGLTRWARSEAWQAVRFEKVMPAGRTRPILLECVRGRPERRERARFVTKGVGLPEVQSFSLAHEFLGARLARAYGLTPPVVEIISLSSAFLSAAGTDLAEAGLHLESGLAVGAEFIPDLLPFPVPVQLADDEVAEAAAIYVFDLLTQNPDRSVVNPNCGRAGRRIVPYDFETAFSFRFAVLRSDAWDVGSLRFSRNHLFYSAVRQSNVDWSSVLGRFSAVTTRTVAEVCSTLPQAWAQIGNDVLAHVTAVKSHWLQFEQGIAISLGSAS